MTDPIYEACRILQAVLRARAPYKTGNLAQNSIRIVGNSVRIGGEIADYAPYTNEPWTKGKNPNEGWIQRAIKEALPIIQRTLSGWATDEDVKNALAKYQGIYDDRMKKRMALIEKKLEKMK